MQLVVHLESVHGNRRHVRKPTPTQASRGNAVISWIKTARNDPSTDQIGASRGASHGTALASGPFERGRVGARGHQRAVNRAGGAAAASNGTGHPHLARTGTSLVPAVCGG